MISPNSPEDDDLERELAELEPPALSAEARARLLAIPRRTAQPRKLWAPSRRVTRAALTLWAAAAAVGLFFGSSGVFETADGARDSVALGVDDADADADAELLADLALPDDMGELP